jgi:predicted acyltransferase
MPDPVAVPPDPKRPGRLLSLDALRGFDMFWIIGGDALVRAIARRADPATAAFVARQLDHVEWEGFVFYDLIFPLFLFLAGCVIPFSLDSQRARGATTRAILLRIGRRTLLLVALGLLCNGILRFAWGDTRYVGVLQRIGVCYGIAAVLHVVAGRRARVAAFVAILLGYWALLAFVPAPGGVAGDLSKAGNLAGWVDRHTLPGKILKPYYGYGDNEGLLSTIPAVATALLGGFAGEWLRTSRSPGRKVAGLAVAGAAGVALGTAWGTAFPVIKNLWTSSFVLLAGGWSLLLLALFYGVIDGLGWRRWTLPLVVIGVNAITIYVVPRFLDFEEASRFFLVGVLDRSGDYEPIVAAAGFLLAEWLFLYFLYRHRIALRV